MIIQYAKLYHTDLAVTLSATKWWKIITEDGCAARDAAPSSDMLWRRCVFFSVSLSQAFLFSTNTWHKHLMLAFIWSRDHDVHARGRGDGANSGCLSEPSAVLPSLFQLAQTKFGWRTDQNLTGGGGIRQQFVKAERRPTQRAKKWTTFDVVCVCF